MSCSGRFAGNCRNAGEQTRVEPPEVPGRPYCPVPGCERPLRGDGACVRHGSVQGRSWHGFRDPEVAPVILARLGMTPAASASAPEAVVIPPPLAPRGISAFCAAATTDQVDRAAPLGAGVCQARICQYRGDGLGVEKKMWADPEGDGSYDHDGNSEVAAYALAVLLSADGVGVVPETVFDARHERTSQQFHPGHVAATIPVRPGERPAKEPMVVPLTPEAEAAGPLAVPDMWTLYDLLRTQPERVYEVLALDLITGNMDRHPGNMLFDRQGTLWGIDNGHATWQEFAGPDVGAWPIANSYLLMWFQGRIMPFGGQHPYETQASGAVTFPPQLVERWRGITKEQFMAAFAAADISTVGNVNLENGWKNLQYIVAHAGRVEWSNQF